jgi:alanine dehydrogenase
MILAIPKEVTASKMLAEKRVGLTPAGVRELVDLGADIVVTAGAGDGAGFTDDEYRAAGARIAYSNEEAFRRAEVVVKVGRPVKEEWGLLNEGALLMAFLHLVVAPREFLALLLDRKIVALGYEVVQDEDGSLPILRCTSEIAGKMAVQLAGRLLESSSGGRGILLGGIPGIPPADVVILGGGTLGYCAARALQGVGATVYVLEKNPRRLIELDQLFGSRVVTALATKSNIEKFTSFADVLIGAVLVPGQRAPVLVTKEMVQKMKPGSLIIDFSIDQGGCVETATLMPRDEWLFTTSGVVHYSAPNVPALVPRTSSHALTNTLLPYLREVVTSGVNQALRRDAALRRGLYTFGGLLAESMGVRDARQGDLESVVMGGAH